MSSSLHWERASFLDEAREFVAKLPANTVVITALLAGVGAVSILAVALSAPSARSVAPIARQPSIEAKANEATAIPTCKEQTWPYVDRSCTQKSARENHPKRPVRVVSTDRGAPVTLNATPVVMAAASSEPESPAPTGIAASSSGGENLLRPVVDEAIASGAPQEAVPMPIPRPIQTAVGVRPATAQGLRRALMPAPQSIDDDGFAEVRAYATPDGRRVTVYRRYENPADRVVITRGEPYERRPLRFPFVSLFD